MLDSMNQNWLKLTNFTVIDVNDSILSKIKNGVRRTKVTLPYYIL